MPVGAGGRGWAWPCSWACSGDRDRGGGRRTDNAYSRFVAANHGAEYMIDDFIPNPEAAVLDPKTVAALPSIAEADLFRVYGPTATSATTSLLRPTAAPSAPASTG